MLTKSAEVKSKSKVVGTAEYPEYQSAQEAVEALGEAEMLKILNQQIRTNAMNEVRASTQPSKENIRTEAMASITAEEWSQVAGDMPAMKKLLAERIKVVEAKYNVVSKEESDEDDDA